MNDSDKEKELLFLCEEFSGRLDREFLDYVAGLASAAEWGVGLEDLCSQIYEYDLKIESRIFDRIERLGTAMGMDKSTWEKLRNSTR